MSGSESEYKNSLDAPSLIAPDTNIELNGNVLTINIMKEKITETDEKQHYPIKHHACRFQRIILLPDDAVANNLDDRFLKNRF
ncbi:MAG: Hsp20 family protein [Exilibacterium sp.]